MKTASGTRPCLSVHRMSEESTAYLQHDPHAARGKPALTGTSGTWRTGFPASPSSSCARWQMERSPCRTATGDGLCSRITPASTSSFLKSKAGFPGIGTSLLKYPSKSRSRMACSDDLAASAWGRNRRAPAATANGFPNCEPRERGKGRQKGADEGLEFSR